MAQRFFCRAAWMVGLGILSFGAMAVEPQHEYRKRVESSQNLSVLHKDLFGENVSLFNGTTDFSVVDIDLPGNSGLPVKLSRRLKIELQPTDGSPYDSNINGAGGWDIDVPYISGMFGSGAADWPANRCSQSISPNPWPGFDLYEVWQGNSIHVPGEGDRSILVAGADTPKPTDGVIRRWSTAARDAIDCIPMKTGLSGEGFRVRTTAGVTYHFDTAVTRYAGSLSRRATSTDSMSDYDFSVSRTKVFLLASRVEDRFGNYVVYQYNGRGNPVRITSNDGREIVFSYVGGNLTSATASGRSWSYQYGTVEGEPRLTSVTYPDASRWQYSYSNALKPDYFAADVPQNSTCTQRFFVVSANFVLSITHPSGAIGAFSFANKRHRRSGVHASECMMRIIPQGNKYAYYYYLAKPDYFDVMSLNSKTITGPGLQQQVWTYGYGGGAQGLWGNQATQAVYPCTSCPTEKSATITEPDGTKMVYRIGFLYALNEGRVLGKTLYDAANVAKRTDTSTYMTNSEATDQLFPTSFGTAIGGEDPSTAAVRPVVLSTIQQDGVTFSWQVPKGCLSSVAYCFDQFARPIKVTKSSSP